tara:strand:- start:1115 stop:1321 length:207 start_codon:yes stop_codon:yes gene_type:complete
MASILDLLMNNKYLPSSIQKIYSGDVEININKDKKKIKKNTYQSSFDILWIIILFLVIIFSLVSGIFY